MGSQLRLKTGFYETKLFDLLVFKEKLVLSPLESGNQVITVPEKDIMGITLKKTKSLEIEIQTWEKIYQGALAGMIDSETDGESLLKTLKESLNTKIICEYEGGK